jgi:hypothetical protein
MAVPISPIAALRTSTMPKGISVDSSVKNLSVTGVKFWIARIADSPSHSDSKADVSNLAKLFMLAHFCGTFTDRLELGGVNLRSQSF